MLYTRKGDTGTTKTFDSKSGVRISKSSCQTEALGAMDELNSFLGLVKVGSKKLSWDIEGKNPFEIVRWVQNCLFIIQAELSGAQKGITSKKVKEVEVMVDAIEKELPPIKSFFISGGTEEAALFDIARTLARKAERRVVGAVESDFVKVGEDTLSFLNRLSSLMYALARFANFKAGLKEEAPWYDD